MSSAGLAAFAATSAAAAAAAASAAASEAAEASSSLRGYSVASRNPAGSVNSIVALGGSAACVSKVTVRLPIAPATATSARSMCAPMPKMEIALPGRSERSMMPPAAS